MSKKYYRVHVHGEHGPTLGRVLASSQAKAEKYGRDLVAASEMTPNELFDCARAGIAIVDLDTGKAIGTGDDDFADQQPTGAGTAVSNDEE